MLEAILQHVKQLDADKFYIFCSDLFYRGNPCYWDDRPLPETRAKFIGLLAELLSTLEGEEDGNR